MTIDQIITGVLSTGALIIGYFVRNLVKDLESLKIKVVALEAREIVMKGEIALLEQGITLRHNRLEEKMVDLAKSMDALTAELRILNNKKD
jgi:hypothetical protein